MAQHGHSEACCSVPPVVADGYKEKGKYIQLDEMKCYATGPSSAENAIFIVYDIFGFSPQALQGADILAHADSSHQYRVYMPDFCKGKPLPMSSYPPDTDEKKKEVGAFFQGPLAPGPTAELVPKLIDQIASKEGKVGKWGSVGMCWGGKIVSLTSQAGTKFSAAAEVHPAMVDAKDAKGIKIPLCMLASGDEKVEDVKAFEEGLTAEKYVETFGDQVHGWMAARGDLKNERVKKEYERGYQTLLDFYHKHL